MMADNLYSESEWPFGPPLDSSQWSYEVPSWGNPIPILHDAARQSQSFSADLVTLAAKEQKPDEWAPHKKTIHRLLITEGHTLAEVRAIMLEQHGFRGTEAQYKRRITQWGFSWQKYIPKKKMLKILRRQTQRQEEEGKESVFAYRGQPIANERLILARSKYKKDLAPLSPSSSVISGVNCFTPSPSTSPPAFITQSTRWPLSLDPIIPDMTSFKRPGTNLSRDIEHCFSPAGSLNMRLLSLSPSPECGLEACEDYTQPTYTVESHSSPPFVANSGSSGTHSDRSRFNFLADIEWTYGETLPSWAVGVWA
ncbi:Clr5 domain-containing protein [Sphaerosporella brunnea]|uniref:Clr5 domain-containing protein n=1 Tax=Sphaerosporella brunnea TaxID=1250544 RepID=A0A5J5F786_9PEZI|nr:Clr5 domain-containing protein [Sphaerosporella brunnea]